MGLGLQGAAEPPSPDAGAWGELSGQGAHGPSLHRSDPIRLDIPAVGVHTRLLRLGLNGDGSLEVPWRPLLAGWYEGSPTPGERGPAVIAGHVDSLETGPAVFYRLGELTPGDTIRVSRRDGSRARFRVTAVRSYLKSDFPTRTVYGNTAAATLRLITCADWDQQAQEYAGNLVVFADFVGPGRGT